MPITTTTGHHRSVDGHQRAGLLSHQSARSVTQILEAHPQFRTHATDDSDKTDAPKTLLGIMRKAERDVQNSDLINETASTLSNDYLRPLSLGAQWLTGAMGIARNIELRHVLEKLELWLAPAEAADLRTPHGLGLNNVLFMAAELLLLAGEPEASLALLLIEEPEAHLHPQLQGRLIDFLERRSDSDKPATKPAVPPTAPRPTSEEGTPPEPAPVQVILTTHSPHFASRLNLERLIIVSQRRCYPLTRSHTKLAASDYEFLRRFLDVTKANLFFARGVIIVEGDAENLLLPTLAQKLGRHFSQYGVSIVNVGSRALSRYARIFQRSDGLAPDIRVACVTDLDLVPEEATYAKAVRHDDDDDENAGLMTMPTAPDRLASLTAEDGGPLRTFVSPFWTLEHDLARCGLAREVYRAVFIAKKSKNRRKAGKGVLTPEEREKAAAGAEVAFANLGREHGNDTAKLAAAVYRPLYEKRASKAEVAEILASDLAGDPRAEAELRSLVPKYLVDAIDYVTRRDSDPSS